MVVLKRILFPTDFSDCAARAKLMAHELCAQFSAELHLLHVIHDLSVEVPEFGMGLAFPAYVENIGSHRKEMQQKALQSLESDVGASWRKQHGVVLGTRIGVPSAEILRYAGEHEIDLIVVGSHGRTGLTHVLLGSVAEKVVRKSPCPVLTVRPSAEKPDHEEHVNRFGIHPLPVD